MRKRAFTWRDDTEKKNTKKQNMATYTHSYDNNECKQRQNINDKMCVCVCVECVLEQNARQSVELYVVISGVASCRPAYDDFCTMGRKQRRT